MEQVFKPFVDRFSQPIILSFIVAWLFWNWKIPLGLIWYNNESVCLLGYSGYEDLIEKNLNLKNSLLIPTALACLYPLILLITNNLYAFIQKYDSKLFYLISKGSKVSWERYVSQKLELDEKTKSISDFLQSEETFRKEHSELQLQNSTLKTDIALANSRIDEFSILIDRFKNDLESKKSIIENNEKYSSPKWLCKFFNLEMWDDDPNKMLKSISFAKVQFLNLDNGSLQLIIKNDAGKVTFTIHDYHYNILFKKAKLIISLYDALPYESIESKDNLLFVIFRDFNEKHIELSINEETEEMVFNIITKNHVYKVLLTAA